MRSCIFLLWQRLQLYGAIALPWLFGKLIRLCRLDDIFRKIGLPA